MTGPTWARWLRWLAVVGVVMVGLTGCRIPLPGDDSGLDVPPCECPLLIREVESIDWVPGVQGRQTDATGSDDGTARNVRRVFEVDDVATEVERLQEALASTELAIEAAPSVGGFTARDDKVAIYVTGRDTTLRVSVTLWEGASDGDAPLLLEPVREVLGTR